MASNFISNRKAIPSTPIKELKDNKKSNLLIILEYPSKILTQVLSIGALLAIFCGFFLIIEGFIANPIIVNELVIDNSVKEENLDTKFLTSRSIYLMGREFSKKKESLKNERFMQMKDIQRKGFENSTVCDNVVDSIPNIMSRLIELDNVKLDRFTVDNLLLKSDISFGKLIFELKKSLSSNVREITAKLLLQDEVYVLQVKTSAPSIPTKLYQVYNNSSTLEEDVAIALSEALVEISAPELSALGYSGENIDTDYLSKLANDFHRSKIKSDLVYYAAMSSIFANAQFSSINPHLFINLRPFIEHVHSQTKYELFGIYGLDLKLYYTYLLQLSDFEFYKLQNNQIKKEKSFDLETSFRNYFKHDIESLSKLKYGKLKKLLLYINHAKFDKFRKEIEKEKYKLPMDANHVDENLTTNIVLLQSLMFAGRDDELKFLLESSYFKNTLNIKPAYYNNLTYILHIMHLVASRNADWIDKLIELEKENFQNIPCANFLAVITIENLISQNKFPINEANLIRGIVLPGFDRMYKAGLMSFDFFTTWSKFLSALGYTALAYEKLENAAKYESDRAWAALNIGYGALRLNKNQIAQEKFVESISYSKKINPGGFGVAKAVFGLAVSVFRQKKFKEYIEKYNENFLILSNADIQRKMEFEYMMLISECMAQITSKNRIYKLSDKITIEGHVLNLEDFDQGSCDFPRN